MIYSTPTVPTISSPLKITNYELDFSYTFDKNQLTRTFNVAPFSGVFQFVPPTVPILATDTQYPQFALEQANIKRMPGDIAHVELIYSQYQNLTTVVENSSAMEEPIQLNPSFNAYCTAHPGEWDTTLNAFVSTSPKYGITSYEVGTKEVTISVASYGFQDLDPTIIGTIQSPPIGGNGGGNGSWLIMAQNQSRQGYFWFVSTTYKFNPNGWDTDFYS
jgi:hypothetical protein